MTTVRHYGGWVVAVSWSVLLVGCGSPDAANIELRKQNQELRASVDTLKAQHDRDAATLAAEQQARPTVPTLPPERLAKLVTTHGLDVGKLTGGDNPDTVIGPDTMLRVYVVPVDAQGTPIKAAGAFTVEAFDLAAADHVRVGSWQFTAEQTRDLFVNQLSLYTYALSCPWQTVPPHPELTVKVTFAEELTGRQFVAQTEVKVHPARTTPR